MATEIANAYISLSIETSRVPAQVRSMFGGVSRQADQAGREAGSRFSSGMAGSLKTLAGAAGIAGGIAGVAAAFKSVVSTGMDFTSSMNTMKAVSSASAAEMSKVSAAARQLANDTSLPATSATDAAAAMVELAKGGFTVEQSMSAARGTLQLAAAAQIDAASAATIQSQALQAFGQDASFAGTAADILANAANASSAEITDVASALQQSGTVANQFGLSMQDTAAAIAMMANAGIQGSDAGTLLKSALLALTDQGEPAQGAIEELGLTVYDTEGKFVGLSRMFGELETASKSMTDEQYQAATATLFGSDAMRLSGIAAQQGAEGYDTMVEAMGRQGAAAEVAAARTEGLPGAWERFKNTIEDGALSIYDAIQGPLTSGLDKAGGGIGNLIQRVKDAGPAISEFASNIRDNVVGAFQALQDSGKLDEWGERLSNIWSQLGQTIDDVGPILMQFSSIAAKAAGAMGFAAWEGLLAVLESTSTILNVAVVPILELLADVAGASEIATVGLFAAFMLFKMVPAVMSSVKGTFAPLAAQATAASAQVRALATAQQFYVTSSGRVITATSQANARFQAATTSMDRTRGAAGATATQMGRLGSAIGQLGTQSPAIARMQGAFIAASTGASKFGTVAGAAAAAGSGLRTAGQGISNLFGGAAGLGLTAVAVGGMALMSSFQQAKASSEAFKQSLEALKEAQLDTGVLLRKTGGAETEEVYSSLTAQVDGLSSSLEKAAKNDAKFSDEFMDALSGGREQEADAKDRAAKAAQDAQKAITELGLTNDQVAKRIASGNVEWSKFRHEVELTGAGGKEAASKFQDLRDKFLEQQEAARRATPGIDELRTAMEKMSDETASAADKSGALKSALDALNPDRTAGEAIAAHNKTVRDAAAAAAEAIDATKGFGDSLGGVRGVIEGTTANGAALRDALKGIVDSTVDAKASGANMADVYAKNSDAFKAYATQYGVDASEIEAIADRLGMSDVELVVTASNAGAVTQELLNVQRAFDTLPAGEKSIVVDATTISGARKELEQFGYDIQTLDNGQVRITAEDAASPVLRAITDAVKQYDGMIGIADIDLNKTMFDLKDQAAKSQLQSLRDQVTNPRAGLVIDDLIAGKNVSAEQLRVLNETIANPKADMEINAIMEKLSLVNTEIDKTASPRTVTFNFTDPQGNPVTSGNAGGVPYRPGYLTPVPNAGGSIRQYADGGIQSLPDHALIQKPDPKGGLVQWAEPETGGEVFIPLAQSKRSRSLSIWRKAGELLGVKNAQQYADGGIRSSDFDELAAGGFGASRPLTGAPYVWGGINWGDCSGAMSAFANLAAGLPIFGSRFATASQAGELAKRGARPGRGGLGDLIFGWLNGGPGGGHTAGILPSGKAVEMGGSNDGGMYGGSPNFGQFTDWAHFPSSMFGPSWSDPGSDPGGFVMRPDGKIVPAGSYDYSASGSGGSGSGSGEDRSLSGMLGNAASTAVSGQVQDLLSIFSIPDKPSALSAIDEYNRVTEERQSQWSAAQKSRSDLEAQQSTDLSAAATSGTPGVGAGEETITYDSGKGAGQWEPYMLRVLKKLNLSDSLLPKFREQAEIESKGDPLAINTDYTAADGSNPSGIMQTIRSTFDAFKSKDFADDIFDPLANLFAGANYVENDPKYAGRGMAEIWPTANGYAKGGRVTGIPGVDANPAWLTRDEFVHTPQDYARNRWAVEAIHSGATLKPAANSGRDSSGPRTVYNINAGNTERAFHEAERLEKKRMAIGLGSI